MRKLLMVVAVVVGLVGSGWCATEIILSNKLFRDIETTYSFYLAQDYSLTQISKKYPSLYKPALIAQKEFLLSFKSSIENMDSTMTKYNKQWC